VSGFGVIERPSMPKLDVADANPSSTGVRPVYFDDSFYDTPIYSRASLPPGYRLTGPAIIEEFGSTTVVFPGQHLEVDPHGILIVRAGESR